MKKNIFITLIILMLNSNIVFASDFYIRGDIGLGRLVTEKQSNVTVNGSKIKLKGKNFNSIDIGVGYYILKNLKAELLLTHLINPKAKGSIGFVTEEHKSDINALLLGMSLDAFSLGYSNIMLNAGIGFSQVSEKVTIRNPIRTIHAYKHKNKINPCWSLGTGLNLDIGKDVILEGRYSYTDFGKAKSLNTKSKA